MKANICICILLTVATALGIFGQDMAYFLEGGYRDKCTVLSYFYNHRYCSFIYRYGNLSLHIYEKEQN
ncbi:hypothetical protein A4R27_22365 [Priestia endophytica]|jgi:hypothetical protein|nr:hypothetical protein A4R27_22365 [Priestia endophytica]